MNHKRLAVIIAGAFIISSIAWIEWQRYRHAQFIELIDRQVQAQAHWTQSADALRAELRQAVGDENDGSIREAGNRLVGAWVSLENARRAVRRHQGFKEPPLRPSEITARWEMEEDQARQRAKEDGPTTRKTE
jgi:hypothetical protein